MERENWTRKSYADYGMAEEEAEGIIKYCRGLPDMGLVRKAACNANPFIAAQLVRSLVSGKGYDRLDREMHIVYGKTDFYAYRRKAIYELGKMLGREFNGCASLAGQACAGLEMADGNAEGKENDGA